MANGDKGAENSGTGIAYGDVEADKLEISTSAADRRVDNPDIDTTYTNANGGAEDPSRKIVDIDEDNNLGTNTDGRANK